MNDIYESTKISKCSMRIMIDDSKETEMGDIVRS